MTVNTKHTLQAWEEHEAELKWYFLAIAHQSKFILASVVLDDSKSRFEKKNRQFE